MERAELKGQYHEYERPHGRAEGSASSRKGVHHRYAGLPFGAPNLSKASSSVKPASYSAKLEENANPLRKAIRSQNVGDVVAEIRRTQPRDTGQRSAPTLGNKYVNKHVNKPDLQGRTAVHHAAYRGKVFILEKVCEIPGADLNVEDTSGWSPLRTAVEANHPKNVRYLLMETTADPTQRSSTDNLTALEKAQKTPAGNAEVLQIFAEYMEQASILSGLSLQTTRLANFDTAAISRTMREYPTLAFKSGTRLTESMAAMGLPEAEALGEHVSALLAASVAAANAGGGTSAKAKLVPLATVLAPVKSFLGDHVQQIVRLVRDSDQLGHQFRQVYLAPATALLTAHAQKLAAAVKHDPVGYQIAVRDGIAEDRDIYGATHAKTLKQQQGAHDSMVSCFAALASQATLTSQAQPTGDPLALLIAVQTTVPAFRELVAGIAASAGTGVTPRFRGSVAGDGSDGDVVICKNLYRILEKALFRGKLSHKLPDDGMPDCSGVLDIYGCVLECDEYANMEQVLTALFELHAAGRVTICRVKDRYTLPTGSLWRDYMVNVVIKGVVFELQVVLKELMSCRKALHGHESFARTRCFAEALLTVGITSALPIDVAASPRAANGGGDDGVMSVMATNATLRERNTALEAEVRALKALLATKDQEIAALSARPTAPRQKSEVRGRLDSFFDKNGLEFED